MKRLSFALFLFVMSLALFAEGFKLSGGVGFAYMNHYGLSTYRVGSSFKSLIENELNALTKGDATVESTTAKKLYHAMMVGLDLRAGRDFTYNEFGGYLSVNVGLPFNVKFISPSPLDIALKSTKETKLNSSFVTDTQIGLYINLFTQSPVQLSIGSGVSFNWAKTMRDLPLSSLSNLLKADGSAINISSIESISEQSNVKMLGLGVNIGLTYFFSNSIGLLFSISDSCYFYDMGSDCQLIGRLTSGESFSYKIAKDGKIGNSEVESFGKNTYSNNFGFKAGFAFRI